MVFFSSASTVAQVFLGLCSLSSKKSNNVPAAGVPRFPVRTLAGGWEGTTPFYNKETQVLVEPRDTHTHTRTCPGYGWYDGVFFHFLGFLLRKHNSMMSLSGLDCQKRQRGDRKQDKENIILAVGLGCNQSSSFWYIMWVNFVMTIGLQTSPAGGFLRS